MSPSTGGPEDDGQPSSSLRLAEWRARRDARRLKQREESVKRAAKMRAARILAAGEKPSSPRIAPAQIPSVNVGCSGWFYWHWRDLFYPAGLQPSAWFKHYASRFTTVELNAPFYSWPTVKGVEAWLKQAARRKFVYTVKVSEVITHVKRFVGTKTLVRDFGYIADLLGPRMGCFLFQLPPSFRYSPARLIRILGQLDPARRNVVEFRHASWWKDEVFSAFRSHGAIFCSCSGPRLPADLVNTADDVYLRFHGTTRWYRHNYTKGELTVWAGKINASGAKRSWAYFNNDREAHAIANARAFRRLLCSL